MERLKEFSSANAGRTISVGPGRTGVVIRRSNTVVDGYRITGPQAGRFDSREVGILVAGTASQPLENIVIRNCTISRFGYAAIVLRYVRSFKIENCVIRDAVYAGILVVSSRNGFIRSNYVSRIGVVGYQTAGMNSYGIALTDDGGPMSANIKVLTNTVENVPQWHGIDTHGGTDIVIAYNKIRGANSRHLHHDHDQGPRGVANDDLWELAGRSVSEGGCSDDVSVQPGRDHHLWRARHHRDTQRI